MKDKLHILAISSWYPSEKKPFSGNFVQRHIQTIALQHQVTLLNVESKIGISKIEFERKVTGNLTEFFVRYPQKNARLLNVLNSFRAFRKALKQIDSPDLIHGHIILSKGFQFILAKKYFRKPLVLSEHASYFCDNKRNKWTFFEKLVIRVVIKNAKKITCVSEVLKRDILKYNSKLQIDLVPNVVSPVFFEKTSQKNKVKSAGEKSQFIHVSTLDTRFKNVHGILEAARALREVNSNFHLKIISDEDYSNFKLWVDKFNLQDQISFAGPLPENEIALEIERADAFVLFSTYETFSCVIAESWAKGIPVISTSVGVAENMSPELGIQIETNNILALKKAMLQFIQKEVHFDAEKIKMSAKKYEDIAVLEAFNKIYQKL